MLQPRPVKSQTILWNALVALTACVLLAALYAIFVIAPVEAQMGVVQKIFYFHVPSAYAMYVGFSLGAVGSALYLWKRDEKFHALAVAGAEVGLVFSTIVLITGPLWARKAWGVYWTWDPRLTSTLLVALVYSAYLVLARAGEGGATEKRFAAGLSLVGLCVLPIIHYAVQFWRGQHPTVITAKGGGLAASMVPALSLGFLLFTLLAVLLVWGRVRAEREAQRALELEALLLERGMDV